MNIKGFKNPFSEKKGMRFVIYHYPKCIISNPDDPSEQVNT
jgi:hypothetical protein